MHGRANMELHDRHFKKVVGYARTSDYVHGTVAAAAGPGLLLAMEKFAPSHVGRGGFARALRLAGAIGIAGGFLYFYQRSCCTCLTPTRNSRYMIHIHTYMNSSC